MSANGARLNRAARVNITRPVACLETASPRRLQTARRSSLVFAACLVAAAVAGCGSSRETAAQAYLALATTYDRVLVETNVQLQSGQLAGAFSRLAAAEHAFRTGLEGIDFPPNARDAAKRLGAASLTLEGLYDARVGAAESGATTLPDQAGLLDQIAAARATGSEAAADLRRALGLPGTASP